MYANGYYSYLRNTKREYHQTKQAIKNKIKDIFHSTQAGIEQSFIPEPYNWKTYGQMNIKFCNHHKETSLEHAIKLYEASHLEVMNLAETFSNEELFTKGTYPWVGGSTLSSYF